MRPRRLWSRINVPIFLLCCLVGTMAGLGMATFYHGAGWSYLSNDPTTCVNCHIMREHYDGWQKASHHTVATCNDCHTPHDFIRKYVTKAENGFWHSKGFTLQDFHEPIQIRLKNVHVLNENCVYCHQGMVNEILPEHDPHSVDHGVDSGSMNCIHCHSSVGHGPRR